ncbi:MAG: adenosylmethionine decarboxylase [Burkholderiaceae bacterium]|jgi:S-adenosylmethionine decarboxylase
MTSALPSGNHWLVDFFGVNPALLKDGARLEALLIQAAVAAGAQVLFSRFHSFGPELGVTGVVLLAESHLSVHTWPESGFAASDIFMCGATKPARALEVLVRGLAPTSQKLRVMQRGCESPVELTQALSESG